MKKKILLIEDSPERVEQLKKWFPNEEIVWHTNVSKFLEQETWAIQCNFVKLLIFDHDLGSYKWEQGEIQNEGLLAYDSEGKTGHDAAKELESNIQCPVLVWSYNSMGAQNIARELSPKMNGANKIYISPFSKGYDYKKFIMSIME